MVVVVRLVIELVMVKISIWGVFDSIMFFISFVYILYEDY